MRDRDAVLAAHAALVRQGVVEPLATDPAETRRWLDHELASLVENRFFVGIDARALSEEERDAWEPRATSEEPLSSPHGQDWYRRVYWLLDEGARAGTIGLDVTPIGGLVTVSSLYTQLAHRRRGVASRALRAAEAAVIAEGLAGLRVPTHWTWQPAVRFYLRLGMWLHEHRHALVFCRCLGAQRVFADEREAWLVVERGGSDVPLIHAVREGERIGWNEVGEMDEVVRGHAAATFALALATRGWPLIGGDAACDALTCAIPEWEASERQNGHEVRTPRIPGIVYR